MKTHTENNDKIEELIRKWATALYLKYEPEELPPNLGIATPSIDLENAIIEATAQIEKLLNDRVIEARIGAFRSVPDFRMTHLDEEANALEKWLWKEIDKLEAQLKAQTVRGDK